MQLDQGVQLDVLASQELHHLRSSTHTLSPNLTDQPRYWCFSIWSGYCGLVSCRMEPIAFASHTLSSSERNYAQLEKEALSLVKRFHQYLYGWKFTIITNHQPLLAILDPKKGIPSLAAAQLQQWAGWLPVPMTW